MKVLYQFPEADFDFSAELERILSKSLIRELIKHNKKDRGLRDKELHIFDALVETFRSHRHLSRREIHELSELCG
jgi:hypothetical protein